MSIKCVTKLLLIIWLVLPLIIYSKTLNCPLLPIEAYIGEEIDNDWLLVNQRQGSVTLIRSLYEKYLGKQYVIKKRHSFGVGKVTSRKDSSIDSLISCCSKDEEKGIIICFQKKNAKSILLFSIW